MTRGMRTIAITVIETTKGGLETTLATDTLELGVSRTKSRPADIAASIDSKIKRAS
jgi:hypothetical protein